MRPPRADIAAPELPQRLRWLNERPAAIGELTGAGPVLVHFFDFAHLSSVRTLPYVTAWHERYSAAGLAVLGIHSPRFAFGSERATVAAGLERLGVRHPVADDSRYEAWQDYGCEGWPSMFLWGRGGALRWFHFGEGEYAGTEEAIREELWALDRALELPDPLPPLRPTDAPGAVLPRPTPELLPGGSASDPWDAGTVGATLELAYEAGSAHATLDGSGRLEVRIDDERRAIPVDGGGLYELAVHLRHEAHALELRPSTGVRVWSVSFAPALR